MAAGGTRAISAKAVAWAGGTSSDRRAKWAAGGLVSAAAPYKEHDAVETALVRHLVQQTNQKRGLSAWRATRSDVRRVLLESGGRRLWLVVGKESPDAYACGSAEDALAAACLVQLGWVLDMSETVAEARHRWERLVASDSDRPAELERLERGDRVVR